MTNNNIAVEEIQDVDWQKHLDQPIRISYETDTLSTSILTIDETLQGKDRSVQDLYREKAEEEIIKRKKVIAGLVKEIWQLEENME